MGDVITLQDEIFDAHKYVKAHGGKPLDIDLLKVTITANYQGKVTSPFYPGGKDVKISGVIRRVEIETAVADMFKILDSCEDLVIGQDGEDGAGGYILADGKVDSWVHQNVQVQGGKDVLFKNIHIYSLFPQGSNCVYMNGNTIDNVVFDGCTMVSPATGVWATFNADHCSNSGLQNCKVTPRDKGKHAILFAATAINPVNENNEILPQDYPRTFAG